MDDHSSLKRRYDIEADWTVLTTCNYRCDYCFLSDAALGAPLSKAVCGDAWVEAFSRTSKRWMLHVTGGEPFLFPGFVAMCASLSAKHYLSLNTNMSRGADIRRFAERVDPARIHYINAALHWEERVRRGTVQGFVDGVVELRSAGFPIFVSLVMTGHTIAAFREVRDKLLEHNVYPAPKVARGSTRRGESYPDDYSAEQRALLREYVREARDFYAPLLAEMVEPPAINVFLDDMWIDGFPTYQGRMCLSGSRFVSIHQDGEVFRCRSSPSLGNLLTGTFRALDEPKVCDTSYCTYYCERYSLNTAKARS